MTDSVFRAVAPVAAVCAAFAAQPSVYQPEARRPDVAPTCGSIAGTENEEKERLQANFGRGRSRKRRSSRLWICQGIKMQKK